jgi:hypothetical protein
MAHKHADALTLRRLQVVPYPLWDQEDQTMQTPKPPFIWDETQARHQAYLQAVEQWQLERAVLATRPTQRRSAPVTVVQHVIRWGQRLLESGRPAMPADEIW